MQVLPEVVQLANVRMITRAYTLDFSLPRGMDAPAREPNKHTQSRLEQCSLSTVQNHSPKGCQMLRGGVKSTVSASMMALQGNVGGVVSLELEICPVGIRKFGVRRFQKFGGQTRGSWERLKMKLYNRE